MTFKEWFNSAPHRAKYTNDHPAYLAAKEAWDEAHEACADVVDKVAKQDGLTKEQRLALHVAADSIRSRGNA